LAKKHGAELENVEQSSPKHPLSSRKKSGVVRAPKEVLHKLQFFVELLHGGVCGAKFVEQSQAPPSPVWFGMLKFTTRHIKYFNICIKY